VVFVFDAGRPATWDEEATVLNSSKPVGTAAKAGSVPVVAGSVRLTGRGLGFDFPSARDGIWVATVLADLSRSLSPSSSALRLRRRLGFGGERGWGVALAETEVLGRLTSEK
jgi:hypothetical protein